MKKYTLVIALLLLCGTNPALAAHSDEASCDSKIVKVSGLVCDFCARALEKKFGEQTEVDSIKVDLDKGQIDVHLKQGLKLDDAVIRKLVEEAGYTPTAVEGGC